MSSFFMQLRGKFTGNFSGRYLTSLLSELAYQDPRSFARAFHLSAKHTKALSRGDLQIEAEWAYRARNERRRIADLAVLSGGEPILLIEIKEDDITNPANAAQLSDYLTLVKEYRGNTQFVHLSRYSAREADAVQIKKAVASGLPARSMRYRDLLEQLEIANENSFSRMLCDYLKDIGVAAYKTLDIAGDDKTQLAFFLSHALGFPHASGLGRLHSRNAADGLADVLRTMMGNLEVLSEWVANANQNAFSQRWTRKFRPKPEFDIERLRRALTSYEETGIAELPGNGRLVRSGSVTFHTQGTLSSVPWLAIELGITFCIDRKKETRHEPISMELYAGFYSQKICYEAWRSDIRQFPSEVRAHNIFSKLITSALKQAFDDGAHKKFATLSSFKAP